MPANHPYSRPRSSRWARTNAGKPSPQSLKRALILKYALERSLQAFERLPDVRWEKFRAH